MPKADSAAAVSHVDPFCDEFLADPYPFHEALREAGPVVWLERYGIYASARHAEVQAALTDWQTFSSAAGVGLDDFRRSKPFRPPSLFWKPTLRCIPKPHRAQPRALGQGDGGLARRLQGRRRTARGWAGRVPKGRRLADIAEAYPLSVFPRAVGLGPEGLENLLPYGTMVFNAFGPRNANFEASMARAAEVVGWINAQCARENLSPGGLGATIWAAVDSSEVSAQEAPLLVRSLLSAGLDTTIIGIGNGLYALAANPSQYQALRENPSLVRSAFDEILRWEAPVQTFFRTTTAPVELGGISLPADAKILLFLAAANRDPRRWEQPERFDVSRRASGHVAFGAGIHMCVGQMLARLKSQMLLGALLARFARIEIAGEPKRKLNNTLRQFASLPVELTPA